MLSPTDGLLVLEGLPAIDARAPGVAARHFFPLVRFGSPTLERPGASKTSTILLLRLLSSRSTSSPWWRGLIASFEPFWQLSAATALCRIATNRRPIWLSQDGFLPSALPGCLRRPPIFVLHATATSMCHQRRETRRCAALARGTRPLPTDARAAADNSSARGADVAMIGDLQACWQLLCWL